MEDYYRLLLGKSVFLDKWEWVMTQCEWIMSLASCLKHLIDSYSNSASEFDKFLLHFWKLVFSQFWYSCIPNYALLIGLEFQYYVKKFVKIRIKSLLIINGYKFTRLMKAEYMHQEYDLIYGNIT